MVVTAGDVAGIRVDTLRRRKSADALITRGLADCLDNIFAAFRTYPATVNGQWRLRRVIRGRSRAYARSRLRPAQTAAIGCEWQVRDPFEQARIT